jgi:hypothetical protein
MGTKFVGPFSKAQVKRVEMAPRHFFVGLIAQREPDLQMMYLNLLLSPKTCAKFFFSY